jgi:hypothetical protein
MPSSIRKALNELPTTLDDIYERALQGIAKEKRQHARRLFQCLVGAIRPLRVEELAKIFAIDFEQDDTHNLTGGWRPENAEEAVLSTCSTLISVIDYERKDDEDVYEEKISRIFQFSHFSVKEYLTSDRLWTSDVDNIRDYHIPMNVAHTVLARACLAVVLYLNEDVDKRRLERFSLVSYAARHWVEHAKYEDVASQVQGSMEELFNPKERHLVAWISIDDVVLDGYQPSPDRYLIDGQLPLGAAALSYAAFCGFRGVVDYLITTHTQDINARYHGLATPLYMASRRGHAEVVYLLLQHNADVNDHCPRTYNWTPLHVASYRGHAKVVRFLLERGADVNELSEGHNTPLHNASWCGRLEVVRLLLGHGADVHIRGEFQGHTTPGR